VLAHAGPPVAFSQEESGKEYQLEPESPLYAEAEIESESVNKPKSKTKPKNQVNPENELKLDDEVNPGSQVKPDHQGETAKPVETVNDGLHHSSGNLSQPDGVLGLEALWKQVVAEKSGVWVPDFTAKQRGQLKQFAKRCPEGKSAAVLEFTLRHWSTFIETVKAHAGLFKAPASPHVGFLLKYVGVAVKDWQGEMQLPETMAVQTSGQATASASKPAAPATPAKPAKPKMTPEQIAAAYKWAYGD
jgi:hypothetical protein